MSCRDGFRVLVAVATVVAVACGPTKKKAELVYEEPVTTVWSGAQPAAAPQPGAASPTPGGMNPAPGTASPAPVQTYPPAGSAPPTFPANQPAPGHAPQAYPPSQQQYPPAQTPPQGFPPSQAAPQTYPPAGEMPPGVPVPQNAPAAPQAVPNAQPAQAPRGWKNAQRQPYPPPTGFPDPSVTTVVVPDQDPTTQTTLKRRTGWVRGGYD